MTMIIKKTNNYRWWLKLIRKKGSTKIYIKLFYLDEYYVSSTGLSDNKANRVPLQNFADSVNKNLAAGTFSFTEAFPDAPEHKKQLFAEKNGDKYTMPPSAFTFRQG